MEINMRTAMLLCEGIERAPPTLAHLATLIGGKSFETAKRIIVSQIGSVRSRERFDDDIADHVFLRLQRTSQVGQFASEDILVKLGRDARRLEGPGTILLYRNAPKGAGIRPGDFASDDKAECSYYKHGSNVIQSARLPREDVFVLRGSMGGGKEYVYLPAGYERPEPIVHFTSFREFYDAVAA